MTAGRNKNSRSRQRQLQRIKARIRKATEAQKRRMIRKEKRDRQAAYKA